jgi:hypothetical protein
MTNQISNAAPMVIEYGTQDLSTRQVPRVPVAVPQHLPKFYLFTEKGDDKPHLVSGAELTRMFGEQSLDPQSKFFNHASAFALGANSQGNALMVQRVLPEDAGPESNLIAWLDVLATTVDLYERNSDGSIKLDNLNDPIIIGTAQGFKVKWVVTAATTQGDANSFGARTITPGDQVDPTTSTQSQRYPIFELKASSKGSTFNLAGLRFWGLTSKNSQSLPSKMMSTYSAFPYMLSVIRRPDANSAPVAQKTLLGEQSVMVTFKQDVVDPLTGQRLYVGEKFISSYENLTDLRYPVTYGDFGALKVYQDNIETLLGLFHAAEAPYIDGYSDITASADTKHLFNICTGVTSAGTAYHSFVFVDAVDTVRFSEFTNVYAAGGSDGTMTNEVFDTLVKNQVTRYSDPDDEVQELAVNPESTIYDSGFSIDTKLALAYFISLRKDTAVVVGTHEVGERDLTASEEYSLAIQIRTRLQMFPESDYFGTPTMRGLIMGRSCKIMDSQYVERIPATYEVMMKSAKYMGASNGAWVNGQDFSGAPGSVIEFTYDFNITWVPTSVRNRNWDVGLNWVQAYDMNAFYVPAFKSVYDDDTSVLNSWNTVMAICQLNKIAHAAHREYSGSDKYTDAQLVDRVNGFVNNRVAGKFDNRFVIVPDAQITDMDGLRGFSWTLPISIYAPNMKTVMTTYVVANRISDLGA